MKTHVVPSSKVAAAASEALNAMFAAQDGREFLFLASGGSAFALLEDVDPSLFGPHSTVGVLDERYSTDPAINNFAQLEKTKFHADVKKMGSHFIDTKIQPGESIEAAADRFERALIDWMTRTDGAIIASAGVGPDSHTSGIMPYPDNQEFFNATFDNEDFWTASYDAGDKNPYPLRVTTTLPFLRKINSAVIFATDESKKTALAKMLAMTGSLAETPARIWLTLPAAELYTDITEIRFR